MTQRSRGFGFVTFNESSVVDTVMAKKDHVIDGKAVEVQKLLYIFL